MFLNFEEFRNLNRLDTVRKIVIFDTVFCFTFSSYAFHPADYTDHHREAIASECMKYSNVKAGYAFPNELIWWKMELCLAGAAPFLSEHV